ncbi:MAG TPA: Ig-like domain-containing protein [Gemmatimonas sp.]|nr:Ig-like domain-containing protein [Gemmatimonas sp.]
MSRTPLLIARLLAVVAVAAGSAGCSPGSLLAGPDDFDLCPKGNEPVGSIRLSPVAASVRVGDEVAFRYDVFKPDGSALSLCFESAVMTIDDATVAALISGRVRGVRLGQTTLRATTGGKTATATITVTSDALSQLDLSASNPTMLLGQVTRVTAAARDSSGAPVFLQSTPFVSDNPSLASVTANGTVVARAVGTATIRLTRGGKTASTSISIVNGPPSIPMSAVSAGGNQTCALAAAGSVPVGTAFCWGAGVNNSLQVSPTRVPGALTFRSISAGRLLTCGIASAGATYCWGANTSGELGTGNRTPNFTPQQVSGTSNYLSVVAADQLACGLLATGRVNCWGASNLSDAITVPTPLAGTLTFVELSAGTGGPGGVCGRTASGTVYCWSRLTRWNVVAPIVASGANTIASVSVGGLYNCGLVASGSALCWGSIRDQLSTAVPPGDYSAPIAVPGGFTFQRIAASDSFFCGTTASGTWCLGTTGLADSNLPGTAPRLMPLLDQATRFVSLSGGSSHACGLDTRGAVWCWGHSQSLGVLDITMPREPLQVRFE